MTKKPVGLIAPVPSIVIEDVDEPIKPLVGVVEVGNAIGPLRVKEVPLMARKPLE
jgi:hypothetical protein